MKIALVIAWTIVGLINLLVGDKISKLSYGCIWACFILELLKNL